MYLFVLSSLRYPVLGHLLGFLADLGPVAESVKSFPLQHKSCRYQAQECMIEYDSILIFKGKQNLSS